MARRARSGALVRHRRRNDSVRMIQTKGAPKLQGFGAGKAVRLPLSSGGTIHMYEDGLVEEGRVSKEFPTRLPGQQHRSSWSESEKYELLRRRCSIRGSLDFPSKLYKHLGDNRGTFDSACGWRVSRRITRRGWG